MRKHFVIVPCFLLLAACASTQFPPSVANAPEANADELWRLLMQGNGDYVDGKLSYPGLVFDREKTAPKQNPPVTFLSCADSRVPPELAFYQTVGDLFVTREAGNVADQFTIASIEYAIVQRYTRVIVVLGHEECGAVHAAIENKGGTPAIDALVARIRTSFPPGHCTNPSDPKCVHDSVVLNARASAKYLVANSETIHTAVCNPMPTVTMLTAYYNLVSGRVEVIPWPAGDSPCHAVGTAE
jgi:carbonic anhydrase